MNVSQKISKSAQIGLAVERSTHIAVLNVSIEVVFINVIDSLLPMQGFASSLRLSVETRNRTHDNNNKTIFLHRPIWLRKSSIKL